MPHDMYGYMYVCECMYVCIYYVCMQVCLHTCMYVCTHSVISIAPLQVPYHSEMLPTNHGYCAGVSRQRATGNCELRTGPRSLGGGQSGIRTPDPPVEKLRLCQCATKCMHVCVYVLYVHACMNA